MILTTLSFADDDSPTFVGDVDYGLKTNEFDKLVMELGMSQSVKSKRYSINGFSKSYLSSNQVINDIGMFKQSDSRWSDKPLTPFFNTGKTIGGHGCAITSFGNILTALKNTAHTPLTVNTRVVTTENGYFDYSLAASAWNVSFNGNVHKTVTASYAKQYILGTLSMGLPPMVGVTKGGGTHFFSVYAYQNGQYYISDPSTYYGYSTLDDYLNAGWTVYRIKVFQ